MGKKKSGLFCSHVGDTNSNVHPKVIKHRKRPNFVEFKLLKHKTKRQNIKKTLKQKEIQTNTYRNFEITGLKKVKSL